MDPLSNSPTDFLISPATASEPDVAALIEKHVALMRSQSPPEACHVLPAESLSEQDIQMFVARHSGQVVSMGAMKRFGASCEIKSMHTLAETRGRGYARALLRFLLQEARMQGIREAYLETGSGPEHQAARALYASEGFRECPAFGAYKSHPLSVYMMRVI